MPGPHAWPASLVAGLCTTHQAPVAIDARCDAPSQEHENAIRTSERPLPRKPIRGTPRREPARSARWTNAESAPRPAERRPAHPNALTKPAPSNDHAPAPHPKRYGGASSISGTTARSASEAPRQASQTRATPPRAEPKPRRPTRRNWRTAAPLPLRSRAATSAVSRRPRSESDARRQSQPHPGDRSPAPSPTIDGKASHIPETAASLRVRRSTVKPAASREPRARSVSETRRKASRFSGAAAPPRTRCPAAKASRIPGTAAPLRVRNSATTPAQPGHCGPATNPKPGGKPAAPGGRVLAPNPKHDSETSRSCGPANSARNPNAAAKSAASRRPRARSVSETRRKASRSPGAAPPLQVLPSAAAKPAAPGGCASPVGRSRTGAPPVGRSKT